MQYILVSRKTVELQYGINMETLKVKTGSEQLKSDIYDQVQRGLLKKNDRLLAEDKLAKHYGLGIKLVRRALGDLEAEGIIIRKKRVGTFIKNSNMSGNRYVSVLHFDMSSATAYHSEIFSGIEKGLKGLNCSMQTNVIQGRRIAGSRRDLLYDLILGGKIDGLLLLSWLERDEIEMLQENNVPFVAAGFEYRNLDVPTVVGDIKEMLSRTVSELTNAGHKRIGMITGTTGILTPDVIMAQEKLISEYQKIMQGQGILHPEFLQKGLFTERDGYWLMEELLRNDDYPSAIIVCGNDLANGAVKALYEHGQGKNITIFPLADSEGMLPKPLMKRPISQIGETAAKMLYDIIEGHELKSQKVYLESELIR
jgi:LacI family transcriptional regulator, galactose operon repressor